MNKLLIASSNPAKIKEYKRLLADSGLDLVTPADLNIKDIPKEDGKNFEENAIIKAKYYAKLSNLPALADDGGLEVDALGGDPGLHTSHMTDEQLINDVIMRMKDVPDDKRQCKLSVAIALSTPIGIMTSYSDVAGVVPKQASDRRMAGYPYRSILYLPNYEKYHIDLTDEEEDILNHRKHALWKIKDMVKELAG